MNDKIVPVLEAVFEPTLNMINQDFAEFPEHRVGFFNLLRIINYHCFPGACHLGLIDDFSYASEICFLALLTLDPPTFKLFMDSVVWGIKHTYVHALTKFYFINKTLECL
jgi:exportin-1